MHHYAPGTRRVLRVLVAIGGAALLIWRLASRPASLPLATRVDGSPPEDAAAVIVFLHGKDGGLKNGDLMVSALREVGLPANVASFSPCQSFLRGELPKRGDLRVLLAHGSADAVCPVEESRSLARTLDDAHRPVQYIEFDGPHTVTIEVVRALAMLATAM
jgi:pimeloyl-ACP methyl ester carboxylesterase